MIRVIVCAAIRAEDGQTLCGARHFDTIMRTFVKENRHKWIGAEQGFIDNNQQFLTREEAWVVAEKANQIIRITGQRGTLYSEDLY